MAERMAPAEFADAMKRFYAAATEVLIRTDAYIDKLVADEVVGLYFPLFAGKSHARKAVGGAQELLRVSGYGTAQAPLLPIGIGVHLGRAYVGTVMGAEGTVADLAALGHDVNLTARLSSKADVGEVLISEAACAASGLDLEHLERRQVELKGHTGPFGVRVMRPLTHRFLSV